MLAKVLHKSSQFRNSGENADKSSKTIPLTDGHSKAQGDLFTHKESEVYSQALTAQAVAEILLHGHSKCHLCPKEVSAEKLRQTQRAERPDSRPWSPPRGRGKHL